MIPKYAQLEVKVTLTMSQEQQPMMHDLTCHAKAWAGIKKDSWLIHFYVPSFKPVEWEEEFSGGRSSCLAYINDVIKRRIGR